MKKEADRADTLATNLSVAILSRGSSEIISALRCHAQGGEIAGTRNISHAFVLNQPTSHDGAHDVLATCPPTDSQHVAQRVTLAVAVGSTKGL
jgi:hypothetical protein